MRIWLPTLVILSLLAAIIGVPVAVRLGGGAAGDGSATTGDPAHPADRLVILTPHNEQIKYEFEHGFNDWRRAQGKPAVLFDWRSPGGTSDLRKLIISQYEALARDGRADEGIGVDLFFGGGEYDHNKIAAGVRIKRDGVDVVEPMAAPIPVPDDVMAEVFPTADIGGERLYHTDRLWVGTCLSSFGIVFNRDAIAILGVDEPRTWTDLADGRYRQWVALADPGHSGSIAATFDTILRRRGWTDGWADLRRVYANSRYFANNASKVPIDVSSGEAAAGVCIDFYGRFQAGSIGGNRVGYVDPPRMTAINADPIMLLRGSPSQRRAALATLPPHEGLAMQFILYCLSTPGQQVWQRRLGEPHGPSRFELRRLPVRRDIYTPAEMAHWTDDVNPFDIAQPFPKDMPTFFAAVDTVSHAMAIDIHDDLRAAWNAICDNPDHPRLAEMLAEFDRLPDELTVPWPSEELARDVTAILSSPDDPRQGEVVGVLDAFMRSLTARWRQGDAQTRDRLAWTRFFRERYRRVVEIARSR